jgi:hypothetical protein
MHVDEGTQALNFTSSDSSTRVALVLEAMETPAPKSTGGATQKKEADKEKDKRLARCGKCINCKSTVRAHLWLPHSPEPAISACGAARTLGGQRGHPRSFRTLLHRPEGAHTAVRLARLAALRETQ